VSEITKINW